MPEQPQQASLRDSLYLTDNPQETTFKYDNQLPSLPLPTIQQSVLKLIETIKPIAKDPETFRETERKALDCIQDANVNKLQELLKKRATTHKNWLEDWWLEFAYLRSRKPLIPFSNMSAPLPIMKYWPAVGGAQQAVFGESIRARRAALSTYFQLSFWRMLRHEQMRPMIHKGVPWSMNQFRYLFNTVRRPGDPKDEIVSWFRTVGEGAPESVEIIVLHKGYIFAIKPVTMRGPRQACILSAPQIEAQLRHIEDYCERNPPGPGVGALTTCERSKWYELRNQLIELGEGNRHMLDRIERAFTVLVLEDDEPACENDIFKLSMCGDPSNRWADKSVTSIAFKNGTFGANADHTPYDGFCTGIMTHYLMTSVEECNGQWHDGMGAATNSPWAVYSEPELLDFQLNDKLVAAIGDAKGEFARVSQTVDTLHRTFKHYGKALLKEHRFHPEAFVQCAIHAAYYRQHSEMAPAYVTASTRRFYNGRTETCRSCYPEMHEFVEFLAKHSDTKPGEAYKLLATSVGKFQQLMAEASNGQGCDRHLMGIYLTSILEENQKVPEMFEDELVQRTNNYVLSTSCGGYWNVCGGVPPLVEDGYGCFYGIEDDAITFCCTAYTTSSKTDLKQFYNHLNKAMLEMQRVMLNAKL